MKRYLLTVLFAAGCAISASAQTFVQPYQPGLTADGITYFLPRTCLRFVVTATRTSHTPGAYAQYAERLLDISDAPRQAFDEWELENISVVPYGIPDPEQGYTIALAKNTAAPLVTLSPDGLLLAVNAEVEQPAPLPMASVANIPTEHLDARDFLTTDVLRAASHAKKAELTADEIYDVRESRDLLAKGQADFNPVDGKQLDLMLQRLDVQERALMTLFTGTVTRERHTFVVDYQPLAVEEARPLFRFSRHHGLVDNDDLSGEPYFVTLRNLTTPPPPVPVGKKAKKEQNDLRYCIPGRGEVTLSNSIQAVLKVTMPVAQFGHIEHLGGELFDKKFTTTVRLNPTTGNVEHIDIPAKK